MEHWVRVLSAAAERTAVPEDALAADNDEESLACSCRVLALCKAASAADPGCLSRWCTAA
jgi:hypothetical protein